MRVFVCVGREARVLRTPLVFYFEGRRAPRNGNPNEGDLPAAAPVGSRAAFQPEAVASHHRPGRGPFPPTL